MDEMQMIERIKAGDSNAFNQLMSMHEKRMYAVALRMWGNREDAQDCLQEAMLRVYRNIGSFKGESSFGTWVYRITMNTCLDEKRRQKNKQSTSLDVMVDAGWSPTDAEDTPERHTVRAETKQNLQALIRQLPDDIRAAVVLRDIQGLSYEEIADALGANIGTIKSRISRGREKLREKILARPELFDRARV